MNRTVTARTERKGDRMGRWALAAIAMLALGTTACGGNDNNPAPPGPVASFIPGTATSASIAQLAGSSSGTTFTIKISATDIPDFFGAAFRIQVDPDFVAYQGLTSTGSFLRDGGVTNLDFRADATTVPGQVIVNATRVQNSGGTIPGVNVVGTRELVSVTFRVRTFINPTADANSNGIPDGSMQFVDPREVCDSDQPVCTPIAVTWSSGSIAAR